ncbi:MAG: ABC transporter permease [Chloroflexota bacterium]|nr:ABC transporter permease [Chloroflexota bacterium]
MSRYVVRRLLQSIPTFFGITLLAYLLMSLLPGGPLAALYFANPRMTPQDRVALGARLGVNDPPPIQYLRWLLGDDWMRWDSDGDGLSDGAFLIGLDADGDSVPEPPGDRYGVLRGDFGRSFFNNRPVIQVLTERLPATLELSISAFLIGTIGGVVVGVLAALYKGRAFDNASRVLAVIFDSIPAFWLGLILLLLFSVTLDWLPLGDRCRTTLDATCPPVWQRLNYLALPVFVLSVSGVAVLSRFIRASMLEIISNDYIRTARSKGIGEGRVWFFHALRNGLITLATFIGPSITGLLGGAVIIETVFNYQGVGLTIVQAFGQRDYPIVMAVTIYAALATMIGFLISDILYGIVDPRIRF